MRLEREAVLVFERPGNAWIKAHARSNPLLVCRSHTLGRGAGGRRADPLLQRNPPGGNRAPNSWIWRAGNPME